MLALELLRINIWPVALQAQLVGGRGAQQVPIVAAVRRVASCATLHVCRLMKYGLLHLLSLIAVASEARFHGIRLQEARRLSCMRVMACDAVALRARVLHLCRFDLLGLLVVTAHTESARIGVGQDNLAVLRRLMAAVAYLAVERRMQECLH